MPKQAYLVINKLSINEIRRIFSRVSLDRDTQCWNWTGKTVQDYALMQFRGGDEYVHRVTYAWLVAPVPRRAAGKRTSQLDHLICDNRLCCNPAHLRLCSPRENALRSQSPPAINARKTACPKGHPYTVLYGQRICQTCVRERDKKKRQEPAYREYHREYNKRWYAARHQRKTKRPVQLPMFDHVVK